MYTLLKPLKIREEFLRRKIRIFNASDFVRIFSISGHSAKYFLERQVKEGFLIRLKRGLYALKTDQPAEEEVANALYRPSYLSFEYALAYYSLIPEMPYTITSATTKPTRLFTTKNLAFSYRTIKKEAFTGYSLNNQEKKAYLIAEKEKALVDYIYFVSLRKSRHIGRLLANLKSSRYYRVKGLNKDKIRDFAKLFNRGQLTEMVKKLL